jgi:hypothetical protein
MSDLYEAGNDQELAQAQSLVGKTGRVRARDHNGEYTSEYAFGRRHFTCERCYRQDGRWLMVALASVSGERATVHLASFEVLEAATS